MNDLPTQHVEMWIPFEFRQMRTMPASTRLLCWLSTIIGSCVWICVAIYTPSLLSLALTTGAVGVVAIAMHIWGLWSFSDDMERERQVELSAQAKAGNDRLRQLREADKALLQQVMDEDRRLAKWLHEDHSRLLGEHHALMEKYAPFDPAQRKREHGRFVSTKPKIEGPAADGRRSRKAAPTVQPATSVNTVEGHI